jgi:hypothetical protein
MHLEMRCFWTQKGGNAAYDYEDAFCVPQGDNAVRCRANVAPSHGQALASTGSLRLAIADGASESSFAGTWAQLLVKSFCRGVSTTPVGSDSGDSLRDSLTDVVFRGFERQRTVWRRCYGSRVLPWYAEQKRDMGAFAAFLGLELLTSEPGQAAGSWNAVAIGDACLFQFRQDTLQVAFPIDDPEDFSLSPLLLTTRQSAASQAEHAKEYSGYWQSGDEFVLLTDAAACWLLKSRLLRDADPLTFLRSLSTQQEFDAWVTDQRSDIVDGQPRLRNDDVTFVSCRVSGTHCQAGQR